jgi:membrane-associated phospholipid phosphatase
MIIFINEIFRSIPVLIPISIFIYYFICKEIIILLFGIGLLTNSFITYIMKNIIFKYIEYFLNNYKLNKIKSILGSFSRPDGAKNCGCFYIDEYNFSSTRGMPSGHCILAGFCSIFVWHYLIHKYKIEKYNHNKLLLFCLFFTFYTNYTRIHFGCHTVQQTIIGTFIGMIFGHYYFLLSYIFLLNKK